MRFLSAKMTTLDLTGPIAANQLAAGAFFSVKMTTQDLTSPVVAILLAAGAFSVKITRSDHVPSLCDRNNTV